MNAIITADFINEIVHPEGKLAGKGYASFVKRHSILQRVGQALDASRENGLLVAHIRLSFPQGHPDHPTGSPLFGRAKDFGALEAGSWGTAFHESLKVSEGDSIIEKTRVSPFFGTNLEELLQTHGVEHVYIAGVATDLVVQAAARDAHDRDFAVTVLSDCCAAATEADHDNSLETMRKIADVQRLADANFGG